jgi:hypothetical protein
MRLANPAEYLTNPRVLAPGTLVEIRAFDYEGKVHWLQSEVRFRQIEYGEKGYRLSASWTMDGYRFYADAEFGRLWRLSNT